MVPMTFNGIKVCKHPISPILKRFSSSKKAAPTSLGFCLDLVKKNDNENFLCTLLLPHTVRNAAIAIRAFNVEISKAATASKDVRIAQMRLKFWEESIERIFSGNPPNQPVAIELARAVAKHQMKKRQFLRLIKAREKQLAEPFFNSINDMEFYSEETVSPIMYLTLEAGGIKNVHADHAASHIGKSQGLSMLLRTAGREGGPWSLPKDLLEESGLDPKHGLVPHSELSKDVVHKIASRAKSHLDKARSLRSELPKGSAVHLLPAIPTANYLNRLKDTDFDVFEPLLKSRELSLGFSLFWCKLIGTY